MTSSGISSSAKVDSVEHECGVRDRYYAYMVEYLFDLALCSSNTGPENIFIAVQYSFDPSVIFCAAILFHGLFFPVTTDIT